MQLRRELRVSLGGLALVSLLGLAASPSSAATTTLVASALDRPIYVTAPGGDSRLFIVLQRGIIKVLKSGTVLPTAFLDIDALIPNPSGNDERGLLGLAFHPNFQSNGLMYVKYTFNNGQAGGGIRVEQ